MGGNSPESDSILQRETLNLATLSGPPNWPIDCSFNKGDNCFMSFAVSDLENKNVFLNYDSGVTKNI